MKKIKSSGFSLIEMMVALGIGSVLMYAMMNTFSQGLKNTNKIQSISDANELKHEIDLRFKAQKNFCISVLGGQELKLDGSTLNLMNQKSSFENIKSVLNGTDPLPFQDSYRNQLIAKYSDPATMNSVPQDDTIGCIGSLCQGKTYGKDLIKSLSLRYKETLSANTYMLELVMQLKGKDSQPKENDSSRTIQRKEMVAVEAYKVNDKLLVFDCKIDNTVTSSFEVCDPNNLSDCVSFAEIKELKDLINPLYGNKHKQVACYAVGGEVFTTPTGEKICRLPGTSCPAGWIQLNSWSSTSSTYCSGCHEASCSTGAHNFSDIGRETCGYKTRRSSGNCSKNQTCYSSVVEVGCY
ncbi:MAG: PilW family protein [Bacteriovoracaceae bacterium]